MGQKGESIYNKLLADGNNEITRENFIAWFVSYRQTRKKAAASKKASGLMLNKPQLKTTATKRKAIKAVKATLRKGITAKKFYEYGSYNTCSAQALMSPVEFHEIFGAGENASSNTSTKKSLSTEDVKVCLVHYWKA